MTLRKKTYLVVVLVLAALAVCVSAISAYVLGSEARRNENAQARRAIRRALLTLAEEEATLRRAAVDWSGWDDTYAFVQDHNPAYIEANLTTESFARNRFGFLAIIDASAQVVFSKAVDLASGTEEPFPEGLLAHLRPGDPLLRHQDPGDQVCGVWNLPTGPALLASTPILTSLYQGPIRGSLVVGRHLNVHEMARLRRLTQLELSLISIRDARVPTAVREMLMAAANPDVVPVRVAGSEMIVSYALVPDGGGGAPLTLCLRGRRDYTMLFRRDLVYTVCSVLVIVLGAGAVTAVLLDRIVLQPVQRLTAFVDAIDSGQVPTRLQMTGADEVTRLGRAFDSLLDRIRRQMEELQQDAKTLQEQHEFIRGVVARASEGLCVCHEVPEFPFTRFTVWNDRMTELTGYTMEEINRRGWYQAVYPDPDIQARAKERMARMRQGEDLRSEEWLITRADGTTRFVSISTSVVASDDAATHVLAMMRDITGRKHAEQRLRQAASEIQDLYDNAPCGYHCLDASGTFVRINDTELRWLGYSREELIGKKKLTDIIAPEAAPRFAESFARLQQNGLVRDIEYEMVRKDGSRLPIVLNASAVTDASGRFLMSRATVFDNTERRQAEAERRKLEMHLQQTQRLESLGVLAGGIAHDFNNLLMGVLGNAELALMDLPSDSPVCECLREIKTAGTRAADLSRQMLAYSGRGRFKVELTDLNRLVRAATDLLLPAIPKGVSLDYDLAAEVPPVEADVGQIRQAIVNLVTNAFEAMGEHPGTVALTTRRLSCDRACLAEFLLGRDLSPGDYVCLEVADSGCGMDRAAVDRVFEPFYTTKFTGRGLGLSVVLGIVRGHGGAIRVQSTPGKGTRVSVLLPSGGAVPLPVAGTEPADGPATWQGRGTVLLVDDEVAVRTAAQRLLERLGLRVRVATSGREAVLIFRQEAAAISCVLLDLTMPGLDGEQTLAALREVQSDARVILASGYSEQDVSERFAGKGLVAVLHKPYELQALVAALRKAIEC